VNSEVVLCVEQVVSECERAGHRLVEASPVFDYEEYLHAVCVAWAFGVFAMIDMFATAMGRTISEENMEPVLLSFYKYSKGLTGADMMMAEFVLNKFRRTFGKFFEQYCWGSSFPTGSFSQDSHDRGMRALNEPVFGLKTWFIARLNSFRLMSVKVKFTRCLWI